MADCKSETFTFGSRQLDTGAWLWSICDDADELKSSTLFRYDEGSVPLLRGFKQEVREVLPSGIEAALHIHATIDQLDFEIHL